METRNKILLVAGVAVVSAALGRYSAPVKIETKTVEVEKKVEVSDTTVKRRKKVVVVQKPDGEKTTTITDDTDKETKDKTIDNIAKTDETKKEYGTSKVTISALAGFTLTNPSITYGLAVSKPILGPITVGVFGFQDSRVGFSLGLTF